MAVPDRPHAMASSLPTIINGGRPARAKKRELFAHHQLTRDPETAKYMPYSEVAFPKLSTSGDNKEHAVPELESLWLAG